MKWHKIDVDEEVFEYLKKNAEPFVDNTPNSVLRRELRLTTVRTSQLPQTGDDGNKDHFLVGTPVALQQILEVVRLVKEKNYDRNEATNLVAKKRGIFRQTVNDKYGPRQLGTTAAEFERLLSQPSLSELRALLINKFPRHGDVIREHLKL